MDKFFFMRHTSYLIGKELLFEVQTLLKEVSQLHGSFRFYKSDDKNI